MYAIIEFTDPYNAARHPGFNRYYYPTRPAEGGAWHKNAMLLYETNDLKDAQKRLLKYFSEDAGECVRNWGIAVMKSGHFPNQTLEASRTFADGTRSFSSDIFTYSILNEQETADFFEINPTI